MKRARDLGELSTRQARSESHTHTHTRWSRRKRREVARAFLARGFCCVASMPPPHVARARARARARPRRLIDRSREARSRRSDRRPSYRVNGDAITRHDSARLARSRVAEGTNMRSRSPVRIHRELRVRATRHGDSLVNRVCAGKSDGMRNHGGVP